jgi:cell division protein FtsB
MRRNTEPVASARPQFQLIGAVLFTIAAVALWLYFNRGNIHEYLEAQKKREEAQEVIAQMKEHNAMLKRQQQSLEMNGFESEKQMRERLGLHKKGESVIFLHYEDTPTTGPGAAAGAEATTTAPAAPAKTTKPTT